jgi:hypothetical protein
MAIQFNGAMQAMKHNVKGQVLRSDWNLSQPIHYFNICFNFYVSIVGLMSPETSSNYRSEKVLSFQLELGILFLALNIHVP